MSKEPNSIELKNECGEHHNYEITFDKQYKQCLNCNFTQKLNYLEICYGLNYEKYIERVKKRHQIMNNKHITRGKIF